MTYKPGGGGESGHSESTKEYIITMGRIIKARNMLMADGYHNADVLDRVVNLLRSRPHTPAAQATEYTIEQIAEIDNRIRKECKAERDQVLDAAIAILKDGIVWMPEFTVPRMKEGKIDALEWAIEKLESLRGGATDEGGERR